MNRVHLLARPDSFGPRAKAVQAAVAAAEALGFVTTVLSSPTPEAIVGTIESARADIERLVIVGGDGLIHRALPALANSGIDVGLVPSGTGNDFARGFGIGTGVGRASRKATATYRRAFLGTVEPVDLIAGDDGRWAASVVTAGFSGRVNARANPMRFPPGQSKYTVATVIEATKLSPMGLRVRAPEFELELDAAFFAVANTPYFGGGMAICPDADPDDGLLDVTLVGHVPAATLMRVMPLVFVGRHVRHSAVTTLRVRWIEIETTEPLWADGEPFGEAPIRLEASSGALRLALGDP